MLTLLPNNLIGSLVSLLAIAGGFFVVSRRNSVEITQRLDVPRILAFGLLFSVAIQFVLALPSTVFLYFNF